MSYTNVQEFNDTFGVETRTTPNVRVKAAKLRYALIEEEFEELLKAHGEADIVEVADALGDILYVTYGAAQVFGISEAALLDEILKLEEEFGALIFDVDHQKETLYLLRVGILKQRVDAVTAVLALIVKSAYDAAQTLDIPLDAVVDAIHKSNMTKLGEDGKPIYNENRKVTKGPNYQTPTADIEELLGL